MNVECCGPADGKERRRAPWRRTLVLLQACAPYADRGQCCANLFAMRTPCGQLLLLTLLCVSLQSSYTAFVDTDPLATGDSRTLSVAFKRGNGHLVFYLCESSCGANNCSRIDLYGTVSSSNGAFVYNAYDTCLKQNCVFRRNVFSQKVRVQTYQPFRAGEYVFHLERRPGSAGRPELAVWLQGRPEHQVTVPVSECSDILSVRPPVNSANKNMPVKVIAGMPQRNAQECTIQPGNKRGTCRSLTDCPWAKGRISSGLEMPQACSQDVHSKPLVCCLNSNPIRKEHVTGSSLLDLRKPKRKPGDIAKKMCMEYVKLGFRRESLVFFEETVDECTKSGTPLIVGGQVADEREFEHMALIGYGDKESISYQCGGSLISPNFVLTAGHCVTSHDRLARWVLLGDLDTTTSTDDARPQLLEVGKHHRHGKYKWPEHYYDVALLQLKQPAVMDSYVKPACLDTGEVTAKDLVATGWGNINDDGDRSGRLMKVGLPIQPYSVCNLTYRFNKDKRLPAGILEDIQFCAGTENSGKDTCVGDSGGPLQVLTLDPPYYCMYHIVGITSFGKNTCGGSPAVYARVTAFTEWIEDIVWPDEARNS